MKIPGNDRSGSDKWLSPMFDVVTTSVYRYRQSPQGPELEDRTLALKMFAGKHQTKRYPTTEELLELGRRLCGVARPETIIAAIAAAMIDTLSEAGSGDRVPSALLDQMKEAWANGMAHAA